MARSRKKRETPPAYGKYAGKLWDKSKSDWTVTVRHCLTEPVCCTVSLVSDDPNLPSLTSFLGGYDVNESIANACKHMLEKLDKEKKR